MSPGGARFSGRKKMILQLKDLLQKYHGRVITRLAAGAIVSSSLSTLIAAYSGKLFGQNASHLLFIAAVGMIGLLSGGTRFVLGRLDAGFVLVLLLFEPIGPVLLHRETAPPGLILTLLLGFAVACLFGHEGVYGVRGNRP
jgi:K+-sensing histidine kinase KdpD